jgi:hypothetical protein
MTAIKTDELVEEYLHRLEMALRPLPQSRRDQLVSEIAEHIEQGRARAQGESEAAVREILDRLGEPEDIAAAALSDEPAERQTSRLTGGSLIAVVLAVVLVVGVTTAGLLGAFTSGGNGSNQQLPPSTVAARVAVPNVLRESATEATAVLRAAGLTSQVVLRPSSSFPPGDIVSVSPPTGFAVNVGSVVKLTESASPAPTESPSNWPAEGSRLTAGMKANHVHSPEGDFAYQSLPVNITGNGVYYLDYGPVSSSFNPTPRPLSPFTLSYDFPQNARFMIDVHGGTLMSLKGGRYYQAQARVTQFAAPYPHFTGWIYP